MSTTSRPEGRATTPSPHPASRDAVVDLIRAVALLRVIVFHASGNLVAITLVPAMPIMFFLGGRFAARSLHRRAAVQVIVDRARRLLLPTGVYLVAAIGGLMLLGHSARGIGTSLLNSVVPVHAGTKDTTADWLFSTLWYLRDYLVAVVLSPLLLIVLRARAQVVAAVVVALLAASFALDLGSLTAMYLAFWLLGMAGAARPAFTRSDDRPKVVVAVGAVIAVVAAAALLGRGSWTWSEATGNLLAGLGWLALIGLAGDRLGTFAIRPSVARCATWLQQRAVSAYLWQMVPVIALFRLAGIHGRSLHDAGQASWIIPAAIVATLVIATVTAPIERRAAA